MLIPAAVPPLPLTTLQRDVYLLAIRYFQATGEPCSLAYLARRLKRHPTTVRARLNWIAKKGWASATTPAFSSVLH